VDQEVAKTLGELELKLQELERELTSIGHRDSPPEPPQAPGKLIDEVVEREGERGGKIDAEASAEERATAEGAGLGSPPVFGGEEVPAQGGAMIEHDLTVEVRETAYGEIPTPPLPPPQAPPHTSETSEPRSIDLAGLVRFRDKLASTMDALIDEYSRLLSAQPPSRQGPGA
jgi:hypothetical protein